MSRRGLFNKTHLSLKAKETTLSCPATLQAMPAAVQTPTAVVTDSVISRRPSVERGVDAQIESRRLFYAPSSISTKSQDRIPGAEHAQMEARKAMFAGMLGLFKN